MASISKFQKRCSAVLGETPMSDCRGFHGAGERCSAVLGETPMSDCIKTGADAGSAHRTQTMSDCIKTG
ncbi:MAG: hypothetical protein F6J99_03970 [Moorea sp. SIO4G3]|nr:hypothetical protein [Moorena sp. SIO4G3]